MFYLDQIFNELDVEFRVQVYNVKQLSKKPTDSELLKLYGLYKQSLFGNCNINEPSKLNIKENLKWKSWSSYKNMNSERAMIAYCDNVLSMVDKYGVN